MLTIRQVLAMESFAHANVVAGAAGLDREARWAHPVDIPQASQWVRPTRLTIQPRRARDDVRVGKGLHRQNLTYRQHEAALPVMWGDQRLYALTARRRTLRRRELGVSNGMFVVVCCNTVMRMRRAVIWPQTR